MSASPNSTFPTCAQSISRTSSADGDPVIRRAVFPNNHRRRRTSHRRRSRKRIAYAALLHGDYCLPNVILDDWRFSGFIDLDHAGLSDRHIDVFWGAWTLWFNLHTSAYCNRFLDAYGRDVIDEGKLAAIAAMECFM